MFWIVYTETNMCFNCTLFTLMTPDIIKRQQRRYGAQNIVLHYILVKDVKVTPGVNKGIVF